MNEGAWLVGFMNDPREVYRPVAVAVPGAGLVPVDYRCDKCGAVAVWARINWRLCKRHLLDYFGWVDDAPVREGGAGICRWRYDDVGDVWDGDCGSAWVFNDGDPVSNDVRSCPQCGRSVVAFMGDD